MEKRPIKRRTSDLSKATLKPWRCTTPAALARHLGCSQRTVREYCKSGQIPEAFRTQGGHWRIRLPFSVKTRLRLLKLQGWPSSGDRDAVGEFELDWVENLALSQLCEMDEDDFVATPFLPGVKEPDPSECVFSPHNTNQAEEPDKQDPEIMKKREVASQIRSGIYGRQSGRLRSRTVLIGQVYQFWRKNQRPPTVGEIAQQMRISRDTFYRRYTSEELYQAYLTAARELKRALPDPDGLSPVQRANLKAKKRCYDSDYDPYSED